MIHYHGGPITPESIAVKAWTAKHGFVSFHRPDQINLVSEICQSFALDNGAFSVWKAGKSINWDDYYQFVEEWKNHPRCDWAVIPDVIEGSESENEAMVKEWPHGFFGVPVWHMDESTERLVRLCNDWPRVAIGSCAEYDIKWPSKCVARLKDVLQHVVDKRGYPVAKLHGLRMLNGDIFKHIPLSSADSTNLARNVKIDCKWKGGYQPATRETRAMVLAERIESNNSASRLVQSEVEELQQMGVEF